MEIENEQNNENLNEQHNQDNEQQQNEQITTGSKQWDDIIDKAAGTREQQSEQNNDGNRKTPQNKDARSQQEQGREQQRNDQSREQQNQNREQQRQGDGEDQGNNTLRSASRKFGNFFRSDHLGNIYDANGSQVAKYGAQRAIFHRIYPIVQSLETELSGLRGTLKNYEDANAVAKREGLSLDEHSAALQMFVSWKNDPIKTMQTLLTMAEQAGRDVSPIKQGGIDMAALRASMKEEIAAAIQPFSFLTEQQKAQQQELESIELAKQAFAEFVEEFPDSTPHHEAIANVMRDKNVDARQAYWAVRAFAAENGLDWKKPLAEQLLARDNRNGNNGRPSGGGNNRRPLPQMNGRVRNDNVHVEEGALDQANADDSWDAIARRSMAKYGIPIN